ncbi:MAG: chemotaxis protein CheA [Thermoanaerobaculia bacterium]
MTTKQFQLLLDDFLLESHERVTRVEELLLQAIEEPLSERPTLFEEARRELHTLKGNAGMMGLADLQGVAHALEDALGQIDPAEPDLQQILLLLDRFKSALSGVTAATEGSAVADEAQHARAHVDSASRTLGSVRVSFTVLDNLVDLLAEMVIFRNRLEDAVERGAGASVEHSAWEEVEKAHEALGKTLGFLQDRVMALRMVPLKTLFGSLRRIVHDEGVRTGKRARLDAVGGDTPMDKALLEVASEALGHLVRNAIAHGIEPPEQRGTAGKPREGAVCITALVNANEIWIDVTDDGKGIDQHELLRAAEARGIPFTAEPYDLLFQPGFSTRDVADVSAGRGIGLSAAAESVQRLGGRIDVASEIGTGTRFRIRLPLSVSITRALLLRVDDEDYALPLSSVIETLRLSPGDGHQLNRAGVFTWRHKVLPLLDLGFINGSSGSMRTQGYVAVIEADNRRRGLIIDDVTGIREIVVKALDETVGNPPGVSGATILGDGRVILILDPKGLVAISPSLDPQTSQIQEVHS